MTPAPKQPADSNPKTENPRDRGERSYKAPALAKVEKLAQVTGGLKVTGPTDGLGKIG